jgi:hypothetical protein
VQTGVFTGAKHGPYAEAPLHAHDHNPHFRSVAGLRIRYGDVGEFLD